MVIRTQRMRSASGLAVVCAIGVLGTAVAQTQDRSFHFDIATRIKRNSGFVNAEIIGVRNAAGGCEKVRATKGLRTGGCFNREDNFAVALFYFL